MKPCDWDSREQYELLIGPLRERAKELGYAIGVHGTLKRDIDLIACPWTNEAVDPKHLAEQLRLVVEKINGYAQPGDREVSEYFLDGCPGGKDHGRLAWTWYLDKAGSDNCHGPYIDLSVMPRIRQMHLDLVRERALTYALRADMTRTEDALKAERIQAVSDVEAERGLKEQALSELRAMTQKAYEALEDKVKTLALIQEKVKTLQLQHETFCKAADARATKAAAERDAAVRRVGDLTLALERISHSCDGLAKVVAAHALADLNSG